MSIIKISKKTRAALKTYALSRGDTYRITRSGDLPIKGVMPNTNQCRWYLAGYIGDAFFFNNLLGADS